MLSNGKSFSNIKKIMNDIKNISISHASLVYAHAKLYDLAIYPIQYGVQESSEIPVKAMDVINESADEKANIEYSSLILLGPSMYSV